MAKVPQPARPDPIKGIQRMRALMPKVEKALRANATELLTALHWRLGRTAAQLRRKGGV
jgi:hypothetical protein